MTTATLTQTISSLAGELPEAPLVPGGGFANLRAFRRDPLQVIWRAFRACGDVAQIRVGPKRLYFLASPDHARHVLVDHVDNYTKATRGQLLLKQILGDGLLTSEGDTWKRQRRIANPAFQRRAIAGFAETMARDTAALADTWASVSGEIDVAAEMNRLTLRIAGETLFSQDVRDAPVGQALDVVMEEFLRLVTMPSPALLYLPTRRNRRYRAALSTLDDVVRGIISKRRESGAEAEDLPPDLLQLFMAARDAETGEGMSDSQLRDEVLTMLLAGHETTANALAWTLHMLSLHPQVADRIAEEVTAVLGDRAPDAGAARSLPYTLAVVREGMRLFPPAWVESRAAVRDDVIDGYRVPAGSFLFISQSVLHRHPGYWRDPEAFLPERFLEPDPGRPGTAYIPFGAGKRKCIGAHFALMEAVIVLAVLARRFRFEAVPGAPVDAVASVTLRPKSGIPMVLRPR